MAHKSNAGCFFRHFRAVQYASNRRHKIEVFLRFDYFHAWDLDDQAWAVYKCACFFPLHSPSPAAAAWAVSAGHRDTVFFQLTCQMLETIPFSKR
jgi:hypothetical protein